jgi:prefoldin alpha subunit
MEQQELFMRMNMLGQEAEKIEQHMQAIDQQIQELASVKQSIEAIKDEKEKNKEILANLGKGIFVKSQIKDNELFVNIGNETVVKKTPEQTMQIIDEQTARMLAGKQEMTLRIEQLQSEMQSILAEAQSKSLSKDEHACKDEECDGNCECEEPCKDCKHK